MADWSGFGTNFADNFSRGMAQVQQQQKQALLFDHLLQQGSQLQIPNPDDPTKSHPLFDVKAQEAMKRYNEQKKAALAGQLQGQVESAQHVQDAWARMQLANQLEHAQDVPVTVQGPQGPTTIKASPGTAIPAIQREASRPLEEAQTKANTANIEERTTASKAERKAAADEPTVMFALGNGQFAPVKLSKAMSHPEFLKDPKVTDLNNQIFAATGLNLDQIGQGWNKRIVNGQLTFEAPVPQRTNDPNGRPTSVYVNGIPQYEQMTNPDYGKAGTPYAGSKTVTKTMPYAIPKEMTPDVLKLQGAQNIPGMEQLKDQMGQPRGAGQPGLMQPGQVYKGFIYKGGDPADQNSWAPQQ